LPLDPDYSAHNVGGGDNGAQMTDKPLTIKDRRTSHSIENSPLGAIMKARQQ